MDKKVKEILAKFEKAKAQRQLKDPKWQELDMFDRGEQWDTKKMPPWIPRPVTNYIHLVKTMKRAAFAIKNPKGKLRPVSPSEIQDVEELQKGYDYYWKKINCRKVIRDVIETSRLLGSGIAQLYWNEDTGVKGGSGHLYEGEIGIKEIDPSSFFPDPTARSLEDCQYVDIVDRVPLEWIKRQPNFKNTSKIEEQRDMTDQDSGDIYMRDSTAHKNKGMVLFIQHFEKYRNSDGGWNYKVTYVAGETIVHEIDPLEPNCYPFEILHDFKQRKDFWGKGSCEVILENQKLINKVESIIALLGTHLQNPQTIVDRRSGINPADVARYGSTPGKTWLSNMRPDMAMTWRQPPPIPQVLFQLKETAEKNIRDITGLTAAYMGQNVGSLQTSSGVNALIDRSTLRDNDQMYDIEQFVERLSRKLIMFITSKHIETRMIRIDEEEGNEEISENNFIPFTGSDYHGLDFDFYIDVSAQAPVTQQRAKEEANQLLTIQGQYQFDPAIMTPKEYIKQSDIQYKDEIIARMDRDELMSKSQMLQEIVMMANEALQGGVPPEEVSQMSLAMLQQRMEQREQGIGSTVNAGQIQQRQGAPV